VHTFELSQFDNLPLKSACKIIARKYGVNGESLLSAVSRSIQLKTKAHGNMKFSDDFEIALVDLIWAFDSAQSGLKRTVIIDIAHRQ
jgi:hypothetical protein